MERNKKNDVIKFFAIFSVLCAHLSPVVSDNIFFINYSFLLNSIGCLGVGIFFIISGYYYHKNSDSIYLFFIKKIRIIIPWIFIGTIVYTTVFFSNLSLLNYFSFILGYGSYLYYLSVLFVLYLIYYKFKNNIVFLNIGSIVSILVIIITSIYGYNKFSYIFILNWVLYFNIGIYISKFKYENRLTKIAVKYNLCLFIILLFDLAIHILINYPLGYWSYDGFVIIIINYIFLLGCVNKYPFDKFKTMLYIGKNSLSVYLIHMPIAGVVVRLSNYFDNVFLLVLRPFITLIITFLVIFIYDIITKRLKVQVLRCIIGLK